MSFLDSINPFKDMPKKKVKKRKKRFGYKLIDNRAIMEKYFLLSFIKQINNSWKEIYLIGLFEFRKVTLLRNKIQENISYEWCFIKRDGSGVFSPNSFFVLKEIIGTMIQNKQIKSNKNKVVFVKKDVFLTSVSIKVDKKNKDFVDNFIKEVRTNSPNNILTKLSKVTKKPVEITSIREVNSVDEVLDLIKYWMNHKTY